MKEIELTHSFLGVSVSKKQHRLLFKAYERKVDVRPIIVKKVLIRDTDGLKALALRMSSFERRRIISGVVCKLFELEFSEIYGKCRYRRFVLPRKLITYYILELTQYSLASVAEYLGLVLDSGNGDHSSTYYYRRRIREGITVSDPMIIGWTQEIESELIREFSRSIDEKD